MWDGNVWGINGVFLWCSGRNFINVDRPPDGAIVGGSGNEGTQMQATRIRWWIMPNGTGGYSGGITGMGWFRDVQSYGEYIDGPFDNVTDAEIYEEAQRSGNLDKYFGPWNSAHNGSSDTTIQRFIMYLKEHDAGGCVVDGGVQS